MKRIAIYKQFKNEQNNLLYQLKDNPRYDGQKRYFSSKGLYEPEVMKSINPINLGEFTEEHKVYETSFENEYTRVIYYKQYNLKRWSRKGRKNNKGINYPAAELRGM